jgi:hypothetical protein
MALLQALAPALAALRLRAAAAAFVPAVAASVMPSAQCVSDATWPSRGGGASPGDGKRFDVPIAARGCRHPHLHHQQRSVASTAAAAASAGATASGRGDLPKEGPRREALVALPYAISRAQADAVFSAYHSRHWLQNPSLSRWARAAKESFLPFWVGDARVAVEVLSAEVGRDELVRVLDRRTGRWGCGLPHWVRVALGMAGPKGTDIGLYQAEGIHILFPGPGI